MAQEEATRLRASTTAAGTMCRLPAPKHTLLRRACTSSPPPPLTSRPSYRARRLPVLQCAGAAPLFHWALSSPHAACLRVEHPGQQPALRGAQAGAVVPPARIQLPSLPPSFWEGQRHSGPPGQAAPRTTALRLPPGDYSSSARLYRNARPGPQNRTFAPRSAVLTAGALGLCPARV
jgi:hypothetical protein